MKVEKVIVHPEYDSIKGFNDIALIRLAEKVDISNNTLNLGVICLPKGDQLIEKQPEESQFVSIFCIYYVKYLLKLFKKINR